MKVKICILNSFIFFLWSFAAFAQEMTAPTPKKKKVVLTSGVESSVLQFARLSNFGNGIKTLPRYTYFFNTGVDINFKVHKQINPFTGISIKNIGIIAQPNDSLKYKYRVYTLGAPLGLKLYFMKNKLMFKTGADISLAFNYKWKTYLNGQKTLKGNEFFSDKTPLLFSSVFAGFSYSGLTLSGNYYLNNFFANPTSLTNLQARLVCISLGITIDENWVKKKNNTPAPASNSL
ncbi:MAG: hypothetical protein JNJ58_08870 [Chitinophagaceae bacterium]|nr:hypothetical protein [Chitinophagaceae bacterium]